MNKTKEKTKDANEKQVSKKVLYSALAGSWYEGSEQALRRQLEDFQDKAQTEKLDDIIAFILPHAGYRFSGVTAMAGIQALKPKHYKRVIVMGPSHRVPMDNFLSVPGVTHYGSPLGEVELDHEFIAKLRQYEIFQTIPMVHETEHSVQIEVPLLQYRLTDFRLIPIVAGQLDKETVDKAAAILLSLIDDETLFVASSDFTHYGPNYGYVPFKENVPERLKELDMGAYEFISQRDASGFVNYCNTKKNHICGEMPIAIVLSMLAPDSKATLVKYDTSGHITGDYTNSVSYLAVAFTGRWRKASGEAPESGSAELGDHDKEQLLKLARGSLEYYIKNQKVAAPEALGVAISPAMKQVRATFVTLEKDHMLRGCIGEIFPAQPLYNSVLVNAGKAGLADRRFRPVTQEECAELTYEISVLTVPEEVAGYNDIVIGKHGIVLNKSGRRAVYLPQVAPEQGWNLEETLSHLTQKAGLEKDDWKEGATFQVFEAIVFGEEEK
ncbi:MAG: AmmeMemoRadiSam system protein B [Sedimentisphaerales bacterium]|nr:AmmeMemoRadiSam system protein B [Sedimentisphaerales bacterium]